MGELRTPPGPIAFLGHHPKDPSLTPHPTPTLSQHPQSGKTSRENKFPREKPQLRASPQPAVARWGRGRPRGAGAGRLQGAPLCRLPRGHKAPSVPITSSSGVRCSRQTQPHGTPRHGDFTARRKGGEVRHPPQNAQRCVNPTGRRRGGPAGSPRPVLGADWRPLCIDKDVNK